MVPGAAFSFPEYLLEEVEMKRKYVPVEHSFPNLAGLGKPMRCFRDLQIPDLCQGQMQLGYDGPRNLYIFKTFQVIAIIRQT